MLGAIVSAAGIGLFVFGVLRTSEWGWFRPKAGGPAWFSLSPVVWLMLAGLLLVWLFFRWEARLVARGTEPLVDPALLGNRQFSGGLTMFFFQYLVQMGVFFVIPLYLSVALGLSALSTGVRILPLSLTLLAAAIGIPKPWPNVSPRRVVRIGILAMFVGAVILMAGLTPDAGAAVVTVPLLLIGLGMGALASQLGAVTVSAVPDERSDEVGGIQNTSTNLGASIGTALAGSIMIAVLTSSFLATIDQNPAIPADVKSQAHTNLAGSAPSCRTNSSARPSTRRARTPWWPRRPSTPTTAPASTACGPRSASSPSPRCSRCSSPSASPRPSRPRRADRPTPRHDGCGPATLSPAGCSPVSSARKSVTASAKSRARARPTTTQPVG